MRSLVISEHGTKLSVENRQFKITRKNRATLYVSPIDIDEIIIENKGTLITTAALYLAAEAGIPLYLIRKHKPISALSPIYGTMTVDKRRALYKAHDNNTGLNIMKKLVIAKIINQSYTIKALSKYHTDDKIIRKKIEKITGKADEAILVGWENGNWRKKLMHIEAEAAQYYWSTISRILPGNTAFDGRDPDSIDPYNTSLNYLYAILYSRAYTSIIYSGLDPYAGLLHTDKSGRESLVYDYSEPFKPIIDYHLTRLFLSGEKITLEEGLIDNESRNKLLSLWLKITATKVKTNNGKDNPVKYEDAIRILAHRLAKALQTGSLGEDFVFKW